MDKETSAETKKGDRTRRENGAGSVHQLPNGSWRGRLMVGYNTDGKPKIKNFTGKTETEVKKKIREFNSAKSVDTRKITVEEYIRQWLDFKRETIKASSFDRLENTAIHQIFPYIGYIQLQQLNENDIQELLISLKKHPYSHSTVKKTYDCLSAALKRATTKKYIADNPMLLVEPLGEKLFEKKETKFFSEIEGNLLLDELNKVYKTGAPKYSYTDAIILMLNTGIRAGEMLALEKGDWDKKKKTLHIQRSAQAVKKRDDKGGTTKGREMVYTSTKTYSGNRTIPLNKAATEAVERMAKTNPESKFMILTSNKTPVSIERLERTFYRILKNAGLEQTGLHTLRHTFASQLFAKKVDIKTISTLLGHANIRITIDTYIHLIEGTDYEAVARLDKPF